jgi:simple sugar transport system permease protein
MVNSFRQLIDKIGLPRLTIMLFLVALLIIAGVNRLPTSMLLSNSLVRIGMNGVMVLAMVPSVQSGAGLNFGLSIGIIAGLIGMLVVMEFQLAGFLGLITALLIACVLGAAAGYLYGLVLNRVRGQEMMIGTYAGFSIVSGMCMFWLLAPFKNPEMIWVVGGKGLRMTLAVNDSLAKILDNLWRFQILGVEIPVGLLLAFALACFLLEVFFRSRLGVSMKIAGANPAFATSCGVNVDKMRVLGTVLSTALGAMGMVIYCQSFGYVQLYMAPLMMSFPAVAAVLIGGASARKATVWNAVLGTALFQTLLTIALPVTRSMIQGDISEVAKTIISNSMILYALTRKEGDGE